MIFMKICIPPWRCLPSLGSNVVDGIGTLGLKGGVLCWRWASFPGKALAGAAEAAPARVLPGGLVGILGKDLPEDLCLIIPI